MFKMYGNYKYSLEDDIYIDNNGNTLEFVKNKNKWFAKFTENDNEIVLEEQSFELLETKVENYIYSKKTKEEIIHTYHKPPAIKSLTQEQKKLIKEISNVGK